MRFRKSLPQSKMVMFYTHNARIWGNHCVLYTVPSATVVTNGLTSKGFTLHRGTRQRYPLPSSSTLSSNHNLQPFVKTTASIESRHQIRHIKLVFMRITYCSSFKTLTQYYKRQRKSYRNILIQTFIYLWWSTSISNIGRHI